MPCLTAVSALVMAFAFIPCIVSISFDEDISRKFSDFCNAKLNRSYLFFLGFHQYVIYNEVDQFKYLCFVA